MKKLCLIMLTVLAMSAVGYAAGQGPETGDNGEQVQQQAQTCPVCGLCEGDPEQICRKIQLSEEQKEQIKALIREYAEKIAAARRDQVKKLLREELKLKIRQCLTEEQVRQIVKLHLRRQLMDRVRGYKLYMYNKLELTDEQKEALWAIKMEFRDAMAAATSREEIKAAFEEMKAAILEILTEEQIQMLEEMRQRRDHCPGDGQFARLMECVGQLELTEEQQALIQQIREKAQECLDNCESCEAKMRILKRTQDRINECLNDQQRAQLRQMLKDASCQES